MQFIKLFNIIYFIKLSINKPINQLIDKPINKTLNCYENNMFYNLLFWFNAEM